MKIERMCFYYTPFISETGSNSVYGITLGKIEEISC